MVNDDDGESPADPTDALESAITALQRSICADGSFDGGATNDGDQRVREWQILFGIARDLSCVIPQEIAAARVGGREHDVTFLEDWRRWLKFTKPDGCGFTVDFAGSEPLFLPARPLQYLRRLKLQNDFWGDETCLEGIPLEIIAIPASPDIAGEHPYFYPAFHFWRWDFRKSLIVGGH